MLKKEPLLLVEGDAVQQALIERMLSALPYALTFVTTADDAVGALEKLAHRVVLCDIDLPGADLLRRLNRRAQPPVAVMLTGDTAVDQIVATMRLGAYDFLLRPFQEQQLADVLARAFGHARAQDAARDAELERTEYRQKRLASRQVTELLLRRQNDKFARALFGNMFTAFSQGRGVGRLTELLPQLAGAPLSADGKNYLVAKDILDSIRDNHQAVTAMLRLFSELHTLVSGDIDLETHSLGDFHTMIAELISGLAASIALRGHSVVLSEIQPRESGTTLRVNADFMRQALRELILNALKFSDEESPITVLLEQKFTQVLVTVINQPRRSESQTPDIMRGENQRLVFEPFFRLSPAVHEEYRTLDYGLGLTFVDKVMQQHHGTIRCTTLRSFLTGETGPSDLVAFEIELPV